VDEQLPVVAAWRLGTSAEYVETVAERPRKYGERVLEQLGGGVPEAVQPPARDDVSVETRGAIEGAVREEAAGGDAVIVGRMAGAVLGRRSDVLRVFVHAPLEWRIAHIAESLHVDEATARAEIARIDEASKTYAREGYRVSWNDPRIYDLVLDTARFGVDVSAAIVVAAARALGA
ncbi:MAG: cytidylate kinase-like family protein, partial [Candidatus Eremiobacteraeota bacterium]|nr:cytidylate kinase-like family protein [Candidatus Eremiobacteraeota bacterium]